MGELVLKRVYEAPASDDGFRILVDRLWPRGLTKERAAVDLWLKEVAPSTELRKWYDHDEAKYDEFKRRYEAELAENPALDSLRQEIEAHKKVTLLHGAKSEKNQALVLRELLLG